MSNQIKTGAASLAQQGSHSAELSTRWFESTWFHVVVFVTACGIVVSRRPDAVLLAQFRAEDGILWYAQAYQYGLRSLLLTSVGYYVTLPRLMGLLVQWAPLQRAPLLFNLSAIALQVLPVNLFLSRRYTFAGSLPRRCMLAVAYLGLPNSAEINATLTNAQWHLALLACMVVLARPSTSRAWTIFDFTVIALLALTGPYCIFLLPLVAVVYWKRRGWRFLALGGALATGALLQIMALSQSARLGRHLGASWPQFIRIAGRQVFISALWGHAALWRPDPEPRRYFVLLLVVVVVGTAAMCYAVLRGPLELKLFIVLSVALFAAALKSPLARWQELHIPGAAVRYWFFPMMGFLASLCWMAFSRAVPTRIKRAAILLLLTMPMGIVRDWRYPPMANLHFAEYAQRFNSLPRGTKYLIPINPPGWTMMLVKK